MDPGDEILTDLAKVSKSIRTRNYADSGILRDQKMVPLLYYQGYSRSGLLMRVPQYAKALSSL